MLTLWRRREAAAAVVDVDLEAVVRCEFGPGWTIGPEHVPADQCVERADVMVVLACDGGCGSRRRNPFCKGHGELVASEVLGHHVDGRRCGIVTARVEAL